MATSYLYAYSNLSGPDDSSSHLHPGQVGDLHSKLRCPERFSKAGVLVLDRAESVRSSPKQSEAVRSNPKQFHSVAPCLAFADPLMCAINQYR